MSFQDLKNYSVGLPYYEFKPTPSLMNFLAGIPEHRQLWSGCSDIRFARSDVVGKFMFSEYLQDSNVLLFCDQDTELNKIDAENLIISCSEKTPVIGSNMLYRQNDNHNWFLRDDKGQEKKQQILNNPAMKNAIIQVRYCGFGLIAIHRSILEKIANKWGIIYLPGSGSESINAFTELKTSIKEFCSREALEKSLKKKYEIPDKLWGSIGKILTDAVENYSKTAVLPETFSFCERVHQLGGKIYVNLGIRPGHRCETVKYADQPGLSSYHRQTAIKHIIPTYIDGERH